MKYKEAKKQFEHALKHQKTIQIAKLKTIMQSMNISLKPSEDAEVKYLRNEIKKLHKRLRDKNGS